MKCSRCLNDSQARHRYCRECQRKYDKDRFQTKKTLRKEQIRLQKIAVREWMDDIKESTPCTDCGQYFPAPVMEWDHLDPTTKIDHVAEMIKKGNKQQAEREIEKCELVCANHHRIRHINSV